MARTGEQQRAPTYAGEVAPLSPALGHPLDAASSSDASAGSIRQIRLDSLEHRVHQYDQELEVLRSAKRNADLEIVELQMLLRTTQQNIQKLRDSPSYRLGDMLIDGFASWRGFAQLFPALIPFVWKLVFAGHAPQSRRAVERQRAASQHAKIIADALAEAKTKGVKAAAESARAANFEPSLLARVLLEIARSVRRSDPLLTVELGREAVALAPSDQRVKWLAFALADAGEVREPAELLHGLVEAGRTLTDLELKRADEIFELARLAAQGLEVPARRVHAAAAPLNDKVLFVSNRSMPFHWSAATMRLQATAMAAAAAGWTPCVVTLPGYPEKHRTATEKTSDTTIAGVPYHRLAGSAPAENLVLYVGEAAEAIAKHAVLLGTSIIHTSGDFVSAYASVIAGRLANIPVVLDYAERVPELSVVGDDASRLERYALHDAWQVSLANEADYVIARSEPLRQHLFASGVRHGKVACLHDFASVFARDRADALPSVPQNKFVFGYIGEGARDIDLESLPEILDRLVRSDIDAALVLTGTGRRVEAVLSRCRELQLADRAFVLPRPKLYSIKDYYAALDAVILPYRAQAWRSPYELVEAIAHGACVIAADLPETRAVAPDGAALAAPSRLAERLREVATDPSLRDSIRAALKADRVSAIEKAALNLPELYREAGRRHASAVGIGVAGSAHDNRS